MSIDQTGKQAATPQSKDSVHQLSSGEVTESRGAQNRLLQFVKGFLWFNGDTSLPEEKLKWELEKYLKLYEFYFDIALKAVGLFAAIVGTILSIYFGKDADPNVKRFLLQAPLIVSMVLGGIFIVGGMWWWRVSAKEKWIARHLKMVQLPEIAVLTYLLWVFGILFFAVAYGLSWLMSRVL
jgi:hypothetical protein